MRLPENPSTEVRVNGMEVPLADMVTLPEVMVKVGTGGAALAVLIPIARVTETARPWSALLLVIRETSRFCGGVCEMVRREGDGLSLKARLVIGEGGEGRERSRFTQGLPMMIEPS